MEDKAYQRQQRTITIGGCQDLGGPGAPIGALVGGDNNDACRYGGTHRDK